MARSVNFDETEAIDKAVRLFWEKGYCDTSAQDIVDRLQLNRSSIYNTFKDKRTLFLRSLLRYRQSESEGLLAFLATQEPTLASVQMLLEFVVAASYQTDTCKGCLMVNSATELGARDQEVRGIIAENVTEVVTAFEDFIRKGQQGGAFPAERDSEALAIALFHSITALRVTTKVMNDPHFFQKNIAATLHIFQ
jgi:TetR/AcrR family transcriptional regulator, transcriptional repressor for nem operon